MFENDETDYRIRGWFYTRMASERTVDTDSTFHPFVGRIATRQQGALFHSVSVGAFFRDHYQTFFLKLILNVR